jgi:hypothetical protein
MLPLQLTAERVMDGRGGQIPLLSPSNATKRSLRASRLASFTRRTQVAVLPYGSSLRCSAPADVATTGSVDAPEVLTRFQAGAGFSSRKV